MSLQTAEPAVLGSSGVRGLLPGRGQAPLLFAALGTLLLTTAEVQPLLPPGFFFVSTLRAVPVMPRGWQAVIVALLLIVSAAAVLRGWRRIPAAAVAGILAVSLAGILGNVFIIYRAVSLADLMIHRGAWPSYAPMFVLPFLSCAAMVLMAVASDKGFAGGVLLATGAAGYLFYLQLLVEYLSGSPSLPAPGRAVFAGMLGSAVTLVAGMTAHGDTPRQQPRAGRAALLVTIAAALAIMAAAAYSWVTYDLLAYVAQLPMVSYFHYIFSNFAIYLLAPAILITAMCVTVSGQRNPDQRRTAGVLTAAGFLTVVYFIDSHMFEWMIPIHSVASPAGPAATSGDIGATAGLALIVTGVTLLAGTRHMISSAGDAASPADRWPNDELARSETTRYLCAAAHTDDGFAREVIDKVVADGRRAVVPSPGMDMGTVLGHCFAARRRQNIRDTLITAILLCFLPLLIDFRTLPGLRDMLVLLLLAAAVALSERWISRYRVITRQLSPASFDPARLPWLTAAERRRLSQLLASEHGNISVYGTYSPFVGSGFSHGGWSFAVNTAKGKEQLGRGQGRLEPTPFDVEDLYAAVRADIQALGLAGILIENRLLADGRSIQGDSRFIAEPKAHPAASISEEQLRALVHAPELQNRAYQCVRIQDWQGELVLSVFINFTRRGTGLLAEVQYYLLAPLKDQYREVDLLASRSTSKHVRAEFAGAPRNAMNMMVKAPFRITGALWRMRPWRNRDRSIRKFADADSEFNFGALTSVRELAQATHYQKYFQRVDQDLNTKLINRQVLDTIMEFLDARNIDISQFEEQRATILNQGLLISGGQFNAGSVAVGEHSRARTTQFTQGIQSTLRRQGDGDTT